MITTLCVLGFVAAGSVAAMIAAMKAPMGYEDAAGFHYTAAQTVSVKEPSCEVGQPKFA